MSKSLQINLPSGLYRRLQARAVRNNRKPADEAVFLLECMLQDESELPEPFIGRFELTEEWLDRAKRDGRA